ncbi:MAG TPA: SpoIIE family protein phosphatase [Coleofasciculaceae cyanobacterium]
MFRLLIIDDDPTIRRLLERTLTKQGYEVLIAEDGAAGLERACAERPALIICDWMMPKIDGIEVCRHVKEEASLSSTFFILLTSLGSVDDRVRGLDAGADDFLSKPIEMNELKARVRAGLRLHQLNQDLKEQKRLLEEEMAEAADYVKTLLPPPMPGAVDITAMFEPSSRLGGDCFDFYWLDDDRLVVYLVDAAGHGLKAALPSLSVLNLLRSRSLPIRDYGSPSEVLRALNITFQMNDRNDKYFTAWYGVYNRTTRTLAYSSAGHPPAVLLSPSGEALPGVQQLRTVGLPVGMFSEAKYSEAFCTVPPDSSLYIFSDGIYELGMPDGTVWGLNPFVEVLRECWAQPDRGTVEQVVTRVQDFNSGRNYFEDDLSLLRLKFP